MPEELQTAGRMRALTCSPHHSTTNYAETSRKDKLESNVKNLEAYINNKSRMQKDLLQSGLNL